MPTPAPEPPRLVQAARILLDEIAANRAAEADLARRLGQSRDRGAALTRALDALLRSLPEFDRVPLVARLNAIREGAKPPSRALGQTPATSAVLAYLAAQKGETVTVAALTEHLTHLGLAPHLRYAAFALRRSGQQGLVSRTRKAVYRINRSHPGLMALRSADAAPVRPTRRCKNK